MIMLLPCKPEKLQLALFEWISLSVHAQIEGVRGLRITPWPLTPVRNKLLGLLRNIRTLFADFFFAASV
jgi:hypothetical protein